MSGFRRTMRWVSLAGVVALLAVFTAPADAGLYYESVTTDQTEGKRGSQELVVNAWVDGDKAKILFIDGDEGMMQSGAYLLTTDGGETLYLINPEEESYFEWSLDAMFAVLGTIMEDGNAMLSLKFSNPRFEELGEEAGGEILGNSTRKRTTRTSYSMEMRVVGIRRKTDIESTQENWVAKDLREVGLGIWLRQKPSSTGNAEFDELLLQGWEAIDGFPLKTITTTRSTGRKGRTTVTVSSMEVTRLSRQDIAAETFEIDPEFTLVEMPPLAGSGDEGEDEEGRFGALRRGLRRNRD